VYLTFHKEGYTICGIYDKIKHSDMFGSGCFIRAHDVVCEGYVLIMEMRGIKIKTIDPVINSKAEEHYARQSKVGSTGALL